MGSGCHARAQLFPRCMGSSIITRDHVGWMPNVGCAGHAPQHPHGLGLPHPSTIITKVHRLEHGSMGPGWAHVQCWVCCTCTPTPTWQLKPNVFGSRQCVQIYFSPLIGSDTLSETNTHLKIFLKPHASPSIFYIDPTRIILSKI